MLMNQKRMSRSEGHGIDLEIFDMAVTDDSKVKAGKLGIKSGDDCINNLIFSARLRAQFLAFCKMMLYVYH